MQSSFKKIASRTVSLAAIAFASTTFNATPVHAGSVSEAAQLLKDNWGLLVANRWSPWNKQVYMTSISHQETQDVIEQYQSRAGGILHDRCVNKIADLYFGDKGWMLKNTTNRWVAVATRMENGQVNCFQRIPNQIADDFIRRRGW